MFGWNSRRKRLLDEMASHIEFETQQNIDNGMSPADARHAAMKKFGSVLVSVEQSRQVWGAVWLENLLQDVRYAIRSLTTVSGYTATLVCTLTLGLGCVTAMLAIVQSVLLRPMDLPQPSRLVQIEAQNEAEGYHASSHAIAYPALDALQRGTHSFAGISGYNTMVQPVQTADGARVDLLMEVTPGFFHMLGIKAKLGRLISPDDAKASVAVINDKFWRERMHKSPTAVGTDITVSGKQWTVIGILPSSFQAPGLTGAPVVFLPISTTVGGQDIFNFDSASVIARLNPGVTLQQALAEAQSIYRHSGNFNNDPHWQLVMRSYKDFVTGDLRQPLWALLGATLVLLLIACANAANLQIGRTTSRMPEMAVRSALGAGLGRLMQQLLTENLLASLLGAALGAGLASAVVAAVRHAYADQYPRFDELVLHPLVLVAAAAMAIAVGIVASVAPALSVRRHITGHFAARSTTPKSKLPGLLVAVQVALTCVLLVTSGLFARTLQSLQNVNLGFDPRGVTTLVLMPFNQKQDPQVSRDIETRLLHKFETLPGIQSVTMQSDIPFSSFNMTMDGTTDVSGRAWQKDDSAYYSFVSTHFVETSGIHLLKGRAFTSADESTGEIAVLVNQAFVAKYLSGREPLGATLKFHRKPTDKDQDLPFTQPMTVVGVVENELQGGDLGAPYKPMVYLDYLALPKTSFLNQIFSMTAQYAVRSSLSPSAVALELRTAVKQNAPSMVEMSLKPMEESVAQSLGQRRLALRLVAGFGIVALILSAIGIYGVLAYSVALRRREIGIRMALGSSRVGAAGLVARQSGRMVLLGLIPGIAGAWAAGYSIRSFLFGVKALDAETYALAGIVLLIVSAAAAFFPALRAAQVNPVETLRVE